MMDNCRFIKLKIVLIVWSTIYSGIGGAKVQWTAGERKLKLVAIVHRHGDRAPLFLMPDDPYADDDFWPDGKSQLLTKGKDRLFQLGRSLRSHYSDFLTSSPREVIATSSDADRCIESAELLLHGLYQANGRWRYNNQTHYLPVPVHTTPTALDKMLAEGVFCPTLSKEEQIVFKRPGHDAYLNQYAESLGIISETLDLPVRSLGTILGLYDPWFIEKSIGYSIPNWITPKIWTDLSAMVDLYATIQNDSPLIHRLRAGPFLDNLRSHLLQSMMGLSKTKLLTYSTHDTMLGSFMAALGVFNGHRVPYGAALMIELLSNPREPFDYYISLRYWNDTHVNQQHQLQLSFCSADDLCPLKEFLDYIGKVIPTDWEGECGLRDTQPIDPKDTPPNVEPVDEDSESLAWKWIGTVTVICFSISTLILSVLFVSYCLSSCRKSHGPEREKQEYIRIL